MSYTAIKNIRSYLCSSSSITNIVDKNNIRVGWVPLVESFPSIIIHQVGGEDWGYLGYKTSPQGSRVRRELSSIQIDILSNKSVSEILQIADAIVPIMIASGNARKVGDSEDFDDDRKIYMKSHIYDLTMFHDD